MIFLLFSIKVKETFRPEKYLIANKKSQREVQEVGIKITFFLKNTYHE